MMQPTLLDSLLCAFLAGEDDALHALADHLEETGDPRHKKLRDMARQPYSMQLSLWFYSVLDIFQRQLCLMCNASGLIRLSDSPYLLEVACPFCNGLRHTPSLPPYLHSTLTSRHPPIVSPGTP